VSGEPAPNVPLGPGSPGRREGRRPGGDPRARTPAGAASPISRAGVPRVRHSVVVTCLVHRRPLAGPHGGHV